MNRKSAKRKLYCSIWPSNRSMERIKQRIRERIGRRYHATLEEMIGDLNPVIRVWNNYHTASRPDGKRFRQLNAFVRDRLRIFLKRKYSDQSRGHRRVHNNLPIRLGLIKVRLKYNFNSLDDRTSGILLAYQSRSNARG